jgi:trafficking protein particle complex subunit 9
VTKSNLSSAEEKSQRELFWYREELFKFIRGHWREVRSPIVCNTQTLKRKLQAGGARSGALSLRQQRMTFPMLETIRTETARVKMSLVRYDSSDNGLVESAVAHKSGKYMPCPNEFVYLRTQVINLSRQCSL